MSAGSEDSPAKLSSTIGRLSVLALVVGNAISVPIFVLPGPLAAQAGPAVVLATLLAAIPATFVVMYNALLASAMPVAGGLYVYISRLTAPFWGFLVPFTLPLVTWASLLVTATGFAEYASVVLHTDTTLLVYVLLAFVLFVNFLGLRIVAQFQLLAFGLLALSLLVFIVPGLGAIQPGNYTPFFTDAGSLGLSVVALFYPFLGFGLLIELGEEIERPGRTIPVVLGAGIVIVTLFYLGLIVVLVGVLPAQQLGSETALVTAAETFLPAWGEYVVVGGAICAVITTVNTTLLVVSRTLMRASRDGIIPSVFATIHPRFETPQYAVAVLGIPPFFFVPIADEIVGLSVFVGLASLTAYFFCAIALWNLPIAFPAQYAHAPVAFSRRPGLLVAVAGGGVTTALFWVITLVQRPLVGVVLSGWFVVGYGYYRYRLSRLDTLALYEAMTTLDPHEQVGTTESKDDA